MIIYTLISSDSCFEKRKPEYGDRTYSRIVVYYVSTRTMDKFLTFYEFNCRTPLSESSTKAIKFHGRGDYICMPKCGR
jgi:hypothetical protein